MIRETLVETSVNYFSSKHTHAQNLIRNTRGLSMTGHREERWRRQGHPS